ncbi:hypothetical protein [Granulicella sp. S156]|uniref:hypothetical protein n=1 Tax=Granulicella sp. S156 TaxID=1747224 RepID=UPI00131E9718|nr:hypothetical protein [Granulicella sp. S156]
MRSTAHVPGKIPMEVHALRTAANSTPDTGFFEVTEGSGTTGDFRTRRRDGTEAITVSQMWHPRLDADPAHRWLRGIVLATCREAGSVINTDKAPTR